MKKTVLPLALAAALLAGCAGPASGGGQDISASGSLPASGSTSSQPAQEGKQIQVQVDWSVLEEREEELPAIFHRWYPDYTDTLIPRTDYGLLIPFAGAAAVVGSPQSEEYNYTSNCYGLMTGEGQVVLDAVCSSIYRASYTIETGESVFLPVLVLEKGDKEKGSPTDGALMALAAADGSWCTDFAYWGCAGSPTALLAGGAGGMELVAPETGETVKEWSWEQLGIGSGQEVPWFTGDAYSTVQWTGDKFFLGCYGESWEEARFLDPLTGEVSTAPAQDWYESLEQKFQSSPQTWWDAKANGGGTYTLTLGAERRLISAPLDMGDALPYVRGGDRVIFDNYKGSFAVTDLEGTVILPAQEGTLTVLQSGWEEGGSWLAVRREGEEHWNIYDWKGALCANIPGGEDSWCTTAGGLVEVRSEKMAAYYRPEDGTCLLRAYFGLPG